METIDSKNDQNGLSPEAKSELKQTAPWVQFVGIGWISYGAFFALYGLIFIAIGTQYAGPEAAFGGIMMILLSGALIAVSAMYSGYGNSLKKAMNTDDMDELTIALRKQKNTMIFMGVLMIILLLFLLLALFGLLVGLTTGGAMFRM